MNFGTLIFIFLFTINSFNNGEELYVLVLAGIDLIFFAKACMLLCFGFLFWIWTLMFQLLLSSTYIAFCVSHAVLLVSRLGVHRYLRGDTARTADLYHIMSCLGIKVGSKKEKGRDVEHDGVCLPK